MSVMNSIRASVKANPVVWVMAFLLVSIIVASAVAIQIATAVIPDKEILGIIILTTYAFAALGFIGSMEATHAIIAKAKTV